MKAINFIEKKTSRSDFIFAFIANAYHEVLRKHPDTKRDIVNLAILMALMSTLFFTLQYMALSAYFDNNTFSVIGALISTGILVTLDRIVVGGDYDLEAEILHCEEEGGDPNKTRKLKQKRFLAMGLRAMLGISIAYCVTTLSLPAVLQYEIQGNFNEQDSSSNREANQQLQDIEAKHRVLIDEKNAVYKNLEATLDSAVSQQEAAHSALSEDVRSLQAKLEETKAEAFHAETCANTELSGVAANSKCNPSKTPGPGRNFHYWTNQANLLDDQVEQYERLLAEKKKQLQQSTTVPPRDDIKQRMATVKAEIETLQNTLVSHLEEAKGLQSKIGFRNSTVRHGPIATNDSAGMVMDRATNYTQHILILLKAWFILLEMSIFIARFSNCGKEYALANYRENLERRQKRTLTNIVSMTRRVGD